MIAGSCFAVDIKNGCNAVEATLFVVAAVLAFPATWKSRAAAVIAGSVILQTTSSSFSASLPPFAGCFATAM